MNKTQLECWHKMQQEEFLGCLEALIACVGLERIAYLLGSGYKRVIP
jgi:hypothetical protein